MNQDIQRILQPMDGSVGEGTSIVELEDVLRDNVTGFVTCSSNEIALINDSSPDGWVIEGSDGKEPSRVGSRNMEVSKAKWDGIRAISGWKELNRTRKLGSKLSVVVKE